MSDDNADLMDPELVMLMSENAYLRGKVEIYEAALNGQLGALSVRKGPS